MPWKPTAVPVNASGSRNDAAGSQAVPRVQAVKAYKGDTRLVVDGVPYQKGCNGTKPDGTKCGNKLLNPTQVRRRRCLGHMTGRKAADDDEG